ncbi:PDZ and LIM domain protein Zasp-like isoform X1 [Daphnia pulex]|uniref:PDZ and LIM domain protein Zasp-like isoform X1 n=2 Tax=Daphnia pulex TaxID=6669 RepID=UPI001EDCF78B|nr:PDZ and LIM domain protein Zasp-like isoform X1 [Daphnia pulex]
MHIPSVRPPHRLQKTRVCVSVIESTPSRLGVCCIPKTGEKEIRQHIMAQALTIQMSRSGNQQPWGFRLQGGLDFATPLTVLRVNMGSLSESAGLKAGDVILRVNEVDVMRLRHQEALDAIAQAGNQFQLHIGRAGIWKPQVTPLAEPVQAPTGESLLTKTSLALHHEEAQRIGSAHNTKAAPFTSSVKDEAKTLNRQQFNSPMGLYSEEKIAETLTSQAEVLSQGVLGINFKKNEKIYDSTNSEVLKMLQEMDKEPQDEPDEDPAEVTHRAVAVNPPIKSQAPQQQPFVVHHPVVQQQQQQPKQQPVVIHHPIHQQQPQQQQQQQYVPVAAPVTSLVGPMSAPVAPVSRPAGVRSVTAPTAPANKSFKGPEPPQATADNPRCAECDRLIVGVFVRLKEKNLHVECFKCSTCGTSLKNVGYYKLNNKLYCDVHAKLVASHQPPAPDLTPITVKPGAPIPKNALTTEVAAKQLGASLMSMASGPPPVGGVRIFPPPSFK